MEPRDDTPKHTEVREADCDSRTEEATNNAKLPLLVAYCDDKLSTEAAEELVRVSGDQSVPAQAGEDLPTANKAALLRKTAELQKIR
jgi:hypothetical protein